MIGGTQGEIGLTSPFSPVEQNNNQNVGRGCDQSPDPEVRAEEVVNLRSMIRMISLPDFDPCLLENPSATAATNGCSLKILHTQTDITPSLRQGVVFLQ